MGDYSKLDGEVSSIADVIWDAAKNVWTFAEVGFEEAKSPAYESALLAKYGFKISDRGMAGIPTSWIATWGKGSPTIGILVEFDALPGLGNEAVPTKTPLAFL